MKRIVMYLILILLTIDTFSEICSAQITLMGTKVGNDQWIQEDNITFKNIVDTTYGNKYFRFLIKQDGNLSFAWRQEPNNSEVILIVDNNGERYIRRNIDWINPYTIPVEIGDNITFQFASMAKGNHTVWLAFPSQETKVIRPPSKPKINQSQDVELLLGNELCISANSTDPGNDSINYSWDWGDRKIDRSGKNVTKCHSWSEEGIYIINITASNYRGFNSSTINLTVLRPGQPPNKPKLNVSSGDFLWFGNELCISANSTDPGNDSINYSWDWGDGKIDQSGKNVTKCHSWSEEGVYIINITASNYRGFNSSTINLTVLRPRPPEILKNECIGYINTNYTYSTKLNVSFPIESAIFLFNYSDGESIFRSEISNNININHSWSSPGTKKIKARALDIQGNPGIWSEPNNVDIYIPKPINNAQNLQKEIDDATNYTEISLVDDKYNVGEISIKGKDHLAIKSGKPCTLLTSDQDVTQRLMLDNSTFINISGLSLNKTHYSLTMDNCSYCRIKDCVLEFQYDGAGIIIKLGGYNEIENNIMSNCNQDNSPGVIIDKSNYNFIKNNSIKFISRNNHYCHIWLINPHIGNRIIKTSQMEELKIKMNGCIFVWGEGENTFISGTLADGTASCSNDEINNLKRTIRYINYKELIYEG